MKKRIISLLCVTSLVFTNFAGLLPTDVFAQDANQKIVEESDIPLKLWYDEEAPFINENAPMAVFDQEISDYGWQNWSIPLGNGDVGANVFGRTESERIQISEKTLSNPWRAWSKVNNTKINHLGGLNNFSETYIDFNHKKTDVSNYSRYLDLETAISGVEYTYGGVKYTREYFTSYPDKAIVIRLDADKSGKLDFTLRPTIPFEQEYMEVYDDAGSKWGTVESSVENGVGTIWLKGTLGFYDIDFAGLYKVYTNGGTVTAKTTEHTYTEYKNKKEHTDIDGTIEVKGATSAYIVITLGTDYELSTDVFSTTASWKPTMSEGPKTDGTTMEDTLKKVNGYMDAINKQTTGKSFDEAYKLLRKNHTDDHNELFGRVSLDLNCDRNDLNYTTDALLERYKAGTKSTYLETLMFQYGRYLLIAASRPGTLPAHLQGAWNPYNISPWASGYWHNVNIQMNYWPAFSTNLAETFEAYVGFSRAIMPQAKKNADAIIKEHNPEADEGAGNNGWTIGVGNTPFEISTDRSAGNLGFTTQMFWDYYRYTKDETALTDVVIPTLLSAAQFITKCVELTDDGYYLVSYSDSPEVHVDGQWYYTVGTTYAQTYSYLNNAYALQAVEEAKSKGLINPDDYAIISTILEQIDLYDPINIGLSGQIKEFREEDYYGSVGDEPNHRHMSQLVGLYPGNLINGTTPAWLDAAMVSLRERKDNETSMGGVGWSYSHKINLYARAKEGDKARDILSGLLNNEVTENLWTLLGEIFQVEANYGATSGIGEMLLQSHEGYIEPLAALPNAWAKGSYTGLVAEGNFEVSCAWDNGVAKTVNVTSKSGGDVSVYYPSSTPVNVVTSKGDKVTYTTDDKGVISFATQKGETYILSNFTAVEKPNAPTNLKFTREGFGDFKLSWTASANAASYNVYVAVENASDYTLVGNTKNTSFTYAPKAGEENARTTFVVTAVNTNGNESKRTLCYSNPENVSAVINSVHTNVTASGKLQAIVDANEYAAKYRLYEKSSNEDNAIITNHKKGPYTVVNGYDFGTNDFTIATRFKVPSGKTMSAGNSSYLLGTSRADDTSDGFRIALRYEDKAYKFTIKVGSNDQTKTTLSGFALDKWYDWTVVRQGDTLKLYADGKVIHTETLPEGFSFGSKSLAFGAYFGDGWAYNDNDIYYDDIKVYSSALTEGQIKATNTSIDPEVSVTFTDAKVKNTGTNKDVTVGTYILDAERNSTKFVSTTNVSYTLGENGTANPYELVAESEFPILSPEVYNKDNKYAVTAVSRFDGKESEMYPLDFGYSENIFEGKEFVPTDAALANVYGAAYGYATLTDGVAQESTGRFSTKKDVKSNAFDATLDLAGSYAIEELRIHYYGDITQFAGSALTISVYADGAWKNVITCNSNDEIKAYNDGTNYTAGWLKFGLNDVNAEKVKITIPSTTSHSSGGYISFYEIECSGTENDTTVDENADVNVLKQENATVNNILLGKPFVPTTEANGKIWDSKRGYHTLTDDSFSASEGRFSTKYGRDGAFMDATVDLEGIYSLGILRFNYYNQDKNSIGSSLQIQTYYNGQWTTQVNCASNDEIVKYSKDDEGYAGEWLKWIEFDLKGVKAEKIRVYISGACASDKTISFYEIQCSDATVAGGGRVHGGQPLANAFDGKTNTYLEVRDTNKYSVEVALDKQMALNILKIYESKDTSGTTASDSTKVEVYNNGTWTTVYDKVSLSKTKEFTEFDLKGVMASKVRVIFENTQSGGAAAKISEISCTAFSNAVDFTPVTDALEKIPFENMEGSSYVSNANYLKFKGYASNVNASQADIDAYAKEINDYYKAVTTTTLKDYSIALGGEISLIFPYELSNADTRALYPNAYVEFKVPTRKGEIETRQQYIKDVQVDSKGRYKFMTELAAAQMNDEISVKFILDDDTVGKTYTASARKYADTVIGNEQMENAYPGISDLLRAMLNYGGYAQKYFKYNTDSLANKGIYTESTDPVLNSNVADNSSISVEGKATGASVSGWTLALESRTDIFVSVALGIGVDVSKYTATVSDGSGHTEQLNFEEYGSKYRLKIEDIAAPELDTVYTVTITNTEDNSSVSLNVSALCYISTVLNSSGADSSLVNVAKAIKLYNNAANAYWNK